MIASRWHLRRSAGGFAAGLLLLAACDRADREAIPAGRSFFQCGAERVALTPVAGSDGRRVQLSSPSRTLILESAVAASGARYVAESDSTTSFWSKGDEATLVVAGSEPVECDRISGEFASLRATGNEPSWRLDFGGGELRFRSLGDDSALVVTDWDIQVDSTSTRVSASRAGLSLVVLRAPCTDTMTGMPYPFAVEVTARGRQWKGCGGDPAMLLRGGEWHVDSLAGHAVLAGTRPTLRFSAAGRVTGDASCNRYTSDYAVTGEGIGISGARTTRMACARELWDQEDEFLALLGGARRFEMRGEGVLALVGDGGVIVARR
jgi:heat shock protein HslJ/membrane-bound inhibitor of C-type lysozyme